MTAQNLEAQAQQDALQDMLEEGVVQTVKSDIQGAGKNSPSNNRLSDGVNPSDQKGTPISDKHNFTLISQQIATVEKGIASKLAILGNLPDLSLKGGIMAMTAQEYGDATVKSLALINELSGSDQKRLTEYMIRKSKGWQDASVVKVALSAYSQMTPQEQEAEQWVVAYGFMFYVNGGVVTKKGKVKRDALSKKGKYVSKRLVDFASRNGGYIDVATDANKEEIKSSDYGYKMALSMKGRENHTGEYDITPIAKVNTPENKEPKKPSSVLLTCEKNDGNKDSDTCNSEIRIKTSLAEELAKKERFFTCYCGGKFVS